MKKIFALVLALIMMTAICVPAFAASEAANVSTEGDVSVTVSYGVGETYSVTIPADIAFGNKAPGAENIEAIVQTVSASNVFVENGNFLTVTVKSANGYKMKTEADDSFDYTVTPAGAEGALSGTDAVEILRIDHETNEKSIALTFDVEKGPSVAGMYTDTLTFTTTLVKPVVEGE